jgi:hypothetical protein
MTFYAGLAGCDFGRAGRLHRAGGRQREGMTMANDVIIGFIGLGTMGGHMATNLQKAGFKLIVHDLHRQSASHHLQAGAEWAETPRELAQKSDVILTSLPEPADVERVALGPNGLIEGVKAGAAYFDLSTNAQSVVKKINEAFAAKGAHIRASERRTIGCGITQNGDLGRRGQKRFQPAQGRARRDRR